MAILAARLLDLLSRPYIVHGQAAMVGASIGVALAPENGTEPDCLLSRADLALYPSKAWRPRPLLLLRARLAGPRRSAADIGSRIFAPPFRATNSTCITNRSSISASAG